MIKPYNQNEGKKKQVAGMFNNIAHRYDFLNHFLSLNIDKIWRRKAISLLRQQKPKRILDIASGTGDLAIEACKLHPEKVIGIDISTGMLDIGREKIQNLGLNHIIELEEGDSENLRFDDESFDAITVAFGVRNFENLEKGLREMNRVLKTGGKCIVLEFSKPEKFPIKQLYNFYFRFILPGIGRLFSKDKRAYTYLPESVAEFPDGKTFTALLLQCGFKTARQMKQTFGIASIYESTK